ncbi:cholesterol esterase [Linderina macrospora]|uniref:Cholesterol esterase n=1 Tax=Linderina macrospora TaxID=4868 RepID=A0ACC1JAK1_9FUNG|nr:cholesterol esterase [Linderina macrospora]
MIYIPFFSRLSLAEYQGMLIAALFFIVEKLLRVFLLVFPIGYVVDYIPPWLLGGRSSGKGEFFLDDFNSFAEIMEFWGYPYEDHLVETRDGFLLGTHRITGPRGGTESQQQRQASGTKPVVLFWHGFMLNSECFVCHPDWINILPLRLAEAGYDVWLGNSRGNKYSYKHMKYTPDQKRFWNFSIDEIANIDVPTTVDYILKETGAETLTYIGFSQGSAQMFMSLSRNKELNQKIEHFIALAPASTPRGFHNRIVDYFIKATPHMLYLLFGRRRAMTLVYFWINILPRDTYVAALDVCVNLLFGWRTRNMSQETKHIVYWHLYSYTSVKAIVHWMQIIRCGELQMYDEDPPAYPVWTSSGANQPQFFQQRPVVRNTADAVGPKLTTGSRPASVPLAGPYLREQGYTMGPLTHWNNTYPLKKINTRLSLFYGGSDSLASVDTLLEDLSIVPEECMRFSHYEHLDFLWADDVGTLVYPKVLALLGIHETASQPRALLPLSLCSEPSLLEGSMAEDEASSSEEEEEEEEHEEANGRATEPVINHRRHLSSRSLTPHGIRPRVLTRRRSSSSFSTASIGLGL